MIKQYKPALLFLAKYVVLYLVLNTAYAWFIQYHLPDADPVTETVTRHTARLLSLIENDLAVVSVEGSKYVPIQKSGITVVEVFEGCNSVNVMIVFIAFLFAFKGTWKLTVKFLTVGLIVIYLINLFRVAGLYAIALHFPESLYFFHKFFFTGVIYLVVFALWYVWIQKVRGQSSEASS